MPVPSYPPNPVVNYKQIVIPRPTGWRSFPQEGDRAFPAWIDWGTDSGPSRAVDLNLDSSGSPVVFSKIVALKVNNVGSHADVTFFAPDTYDAVTVPGNAEGLFLIETAGRRLLISSPSAQAGDITYFMVYNSYPPPAALTKSVFQSVIAATNFLMTATGIQHLTPLASVFNGVIQNLNILAAFITAGSVAGSFLVQDRASTPNILYAGAVYCSGASQFTQIICNLNDAEIPFIGGIDLNITGAAAGTTNLYVNGYYR